MRRVGGHDGRMDWWVGWRYEMDGRVVVMDGMNGCMGGRDGRVGWIDGWDRWLGMCVR